MKNILVAIDFDGEAHTLVDFAATFAQKFQATLWIVHIAAPEPDFVGYDTGPQYVRDVRAEDLRSEHKTLQEMADTLNQNGIKTEALLVQGSTVETILTEAEKLEIDLLVIGAHEYGLLKNLFVENTAHELLKKSSIPLLIYPFG